MNRGKSPDIKTYSDFFNFVPIEEAQESPHTVLAVTSDNRTISSKSGNVCVIGSSGSMKGTSVMANSILASKNAGESLVVVDPHGALFDCTADALEDAGYKVRRLDLQNPAESHEWNPLAVVQFYPDCEIQEGIKEFVENFLFHFRAIYKDDNELEYSMQRMLFTAVIYYLTIRSGIPTLTDAYDFLNMPLDAISSEIALLEKIAQMPAAYKKFKAHQMFENFAAAAGSNANNIRLLLLSKLEFATRGELHDITEEGGIYVAEVGTTKCAYFVTCHPDRERPENVLGTLFVQMAFDAVIETAQHGNGGLRKEVHFVIDDMPDAAETIRSFLLNLQLGRGRAHFTVSMQSPYQMSEKDQNWSHCFRTFVFTGNGFLSHDTMRFLHTIGGSAACELYERLAVDTALALVCVPGKCAYLGKKAHYTAIFPHSVTSPVRQEVKRALFDKTPESKSERAPGTILGFDSGNYLSRKRDDSNNGNLLVVGSSGSMKTRGFALNTIIGCKNRRESMLILDVKSKLFKETAMWLKNAGYTVRILNVADPKNSNAWAVLGNHLIDMEDLEENKQLLAAIDNPAHKPLFMRDEIDLELPAREKCAYFLNISSDGDASGLELARLFVDTFYRAAFKIIDALEAQGRPVVPVNVILDEFAMLGEVNDFHRLLSLSLPRKMKTTLVLQSISQLNEIYGSTHASSILASMDTQVCTSTNDIKTAEHFSYMCGSTEVKANGKKSKQRPNLTAEEIMASLRQPMNDCLICGRGTQHHIFCKALDYSSDYQSRQFKRVVGEFDAAELLK